jgi:3-oxoadipate enol-lactonase
MDQQQRTWLAGIMADQDRKLMATAWQQAMAFDSRGRLAELRCPTLVMAASHDSAVPIHHANMMHNGIVHSRLVIIDGADHTLIWTHPNQFLQAVDEFISA